LTGDVFAEVEIGGLGVQSAVLIVSHPCTMRAGAALKPRLQAVAVQQDSRPIDFRAWTEGHFRVMPLPALDTSHPTRHFSATLSEIGLIESGDLSIENRTACLSETGIYLLQQRMVFCQTRTCIGLDRFGEASQHVLEEAELLEEWSEQLSGEASDGEPIHDDAAMTFDEFMRQPATAPLRSRLELTRERAGVRRTVRAEIKRRLEERSVQSNLS
jgi:hypothetical protein